MNSLPEAHGYIDAGTSSLVPPKPHTNMKSDDCCTSYIFNSSIVVYLYVVSPTFCLHNGAFKEQEVARQKLLSGGGKHMK